MQADWIDPRTPRLSCCLGLLPLQSITNEMIYEAILHCAYQYCCICGQLQYERDDIPYIQKKITCRKFRYYPLVKQIRKFYIASCLLWKKLACEKFAIFPTSQFEASEFLSLYCSYKASCQPGQSWAIPFTAHDYQTHSIPFTDKVSLTLIQN